MSACAFGFRKAMEALFTTQQAVKPLASAVASNPGGYEDGGPRGVTGIRPQQAGGHQPHIKRDCRHAGAPGQQGKRSLKGCPMGRKGYGVFCQWCDSMPDVLNQLPLRLENGSYALQTADGFNYVTAVNTHVLQTTGGISTRISDPNAAPQIGYTAKFEMMMIDRTETLLSPGSGERGGGQWHQGKE